MGDAVSVLLLSGGLDSAILLADLHSKGIRPLCMTFYYGQRHEKEIEAAEQIAKRYCCDHRLVDLFGVFPPCPLTNFGNIHLGKPHDDPAQAMTIVPNRNAVFISIAAAEASTRPVREVFLACHASDQSVYLDCRASFISSMGGAMFFACGVRLHSPFLKMSRTEVVQLGRRLNAPFDIAWSCYVGGGEPCGQCGACVERKEAGA